jgi:hypothetical protein
MHILCKVQGVSCKWKVLVRGQGGKKPKILFPLLSIKDSIYVIAENSFIDQAPDNNHFTTEESAR